MIEGTVETSFPCGILTIKENEGEGRGHFFCCFELLPLCHQWDELVAIVTTKSMNTINHIKLFPDKFMKKSLSFMAFAQIIKQLFGFRW